MICKLWAMSALCAVSLAVPTLLPFAPASAERPEDMKILSDYFKMLGTKVSNLKDMAAAPVCDYNKAAMPVAAPTPLPPPTAGLSLKQVTIGRGTQNYTCDTTNSTAVPVAIGAVANLYDATCIAATFPELLALLPGVALQFNLLSPEQKSLTPSNIPISGHHYFTGPTPVFDLDTAGPKKLGSVSCAKDAAVPAPADAIVGQGNKGFGAVAWLKLSSKDKSGKLQEVYRLNTAGGNPPKTCTGMQATFEVQYATEYWFYGFE